MKSVPSHNELFFYFMRSGTSNLGPLPGIEIMFRNEKLYTNLPCAETWIQ